MRPLLGSRLYLAKSKDRPPTWVIRDGARMIRTGAAEHELDRAQDALDRYQIRSGELGGIISELPKVVLTAKPPATPSTLYFVTCDTPGFPIKIGVTSNLERRVKSFQCALPFEVVTLGAFPGRSHLDEQITHAKFASYRLRGEWFSRAPEIFDEIEYLRTFKHDE